VNFYDPVVAPLLFKETVALYFLPGSNIDPALFEQRINRFRAVYGDKVFIEELAELTGSAAQERTATQFNQWLDSYTFNFDSPDDGLSYALAKGRPSPLVDDQMSVLQLRMYAAKNSGINFPVAMQYLFVRYLVKNHRFDELKAIVSQKDCSGKLVFFLLSELLKSQETDFFQSVLGLTEERPDLIQTWQWVYLAERAASLSNLELFKSIYSHIQAPVDQLNLVMGLSLQLNSESPIRDFVKARILEFKIEGKVNASQTALAILYSAYLSGKPNQFSVAKIGFFNDLKVAAANYRSPETLAYLKLLMVSDSDRTYERVLTFLSYQNKEKLKAMLPELLGFGLDHAVVDGLDSTVTLAKVLGIDSAVLYSVLESRMAALDMKQLRKLSPLIAGLASSERLKLLSDFYIANPEDHAGIFDAWVGRNDLQKSW